MTKRKAVDIYSLAPLEQDTEPVAIAEFSIEDAHNQRDAARDRIQQLEDERASIAKKGGILGILKRGSKKADKDAMLAGVADAIATASDELNAAQAALVLAAHRHYEDQLRDKRIGFDEIACSQWRADEPDGEPCCHCNRVPGNTLPQDFVPHDETNYQGKPWCAVHQSADCAEPCPMPTLDVYLRRFVLG